MMDDQQDFEGWQKSVRQYAVADNRIGCTQTEFD